MPSIKEPCNLRLTRLKLLKNVCLSEAEVSCILRSSDENAVEISVHDDGDELGKVVTLGKRGYWVTVTDWNRNFIDLETAEEYISQKKLRFRTKEDLSAEMQRGSDVGHDENQFDEGYNVGHDEIELV